MWRLCACAEVSARAGGGNRSGGRGSSYKPTMGGRGGGGGDGRGRGGDRSGGIGDDAHTHPIIYIHICRIPMMWNCEECMFEVLCTRSQILGSPLESIRGILMLSEGLPKKRKERLLLWSV